MTAASIVTGNCAIFKPSGLSPVTGFKLCDLFRSVGLPAGVLQFLPGPGNEAGEYLVSHPSVDFIAFTGWKDWWIAAAAETVQGHETKRIGVRRKNAVIVDETADIDEAVKESSSRPSTGKKCSAAAPDRCGRCIQRLCDRLTQAVSSMPIGPPNRQPVGAGDR
jgi:RHH-type proline utilization regulon transcriptional repressor/proline dehydrogenase/delta 1-pyrroline-5-carboxylate dehydrogenase